MAGGKYERWLTEEGLERIGQWVREGVTDRELAEKLGVTHRTLRRWARDYEQIGQALRRERGAAADPVENALYKRALGYNVTVKVPMRVKKRVQDPETGQWEEREVIEMVEREKHVPPDMKAVQFWLTNREKLRWQKTPGPEEEQEGVTVIIDV